jgi:AcrR family transcriptional regulator
MRTIHARISQPSSDGRVRRGARNGRAIVDALVDLVGSGIPAPTARQVAARAGVGLRTVFRRFSDKESLFAEMSTRLEAEVLPLLLQGEPQGDIRTRARVLVRRRVAFFERIAPYKRAANLMRWRSPYLRARHAQLVGILRDDLERWLPEVARAPACVADALDVATSFEAWDRLRTEQRLGRERAHAATECIVLGVAAELPTNASVMSNGGENVHDAPTNRRKLDGVSARRAAVRALVDRNRRSSDTRSVAAD